MNLLWKIERHLKQTGQSPTRFGRTVAGDPRLISDLRRGREVRRKLQEKIEKFISSHSQSCAE